MVSSPILLLFPFLYLTFIWLSSIFHQTGAQQNLLEALMPLLCFWEIQILLDVIHLEPNIFLQHMQEKHCLMGITTTAGTIYLAKETSERACFWLTVWKDTAHRGEEPWWGRVSVWLCCVCNWEAGWWLLVLSWLSLIFLFIQPRAPS